MTKKMNEGSGVKVGGEGFVIGQKIVLDDGGFLVIEDAAMATVANVVWRYAAETLSEDGHREAMRQVNDALTAIGKAGLVFAPLNNLMGKGGEAWRIRDDEPENIGGRFFDPFTESGAHVRALISCGEFAAHNPDDETEQNDV